MCVCGCVCVGGGGGVSISIYYYYYIYSLNLHCLPTHPHQLVVKWTEPFRLYFTAAVVKCPLANSAGYINFSFSLGS